MKMCTHKKANTEPPARTPLLSHFERIAMRAQRFEGFRRAVFILGASLQRTLGIIAIITAVEDSIPAGGCQIKSYLF